jgi:hypothetical protein
METTNIRGGVASPQQGGRLKKNAPPLFRLVEVVEVVTPDGILGDEFCPPPETGRVL